MKQLTKIPSELIRLAVEDMKKAIKAGFQVNMSFWMSGNINVDANKECSVCFAGSTMLGILNKNTAKNSTITESSFGKENVKCFLALDRIRQGHLAGMLHVLGVESSKRTKFTELGPIEHIQDFKEFEDCENPQEFYDQMEEIAEYLESVGY